MIPATIFPAIAVSSSPDLFHLVSATPQIRNQRERMSQVIIVCHDRLMPLPATPLGKKYRDATALRLFQPDIPKVSCEFSDLDKIKNNFVYRRKPAEPSLCAAGGRNQLSRRLTIRSLSSLLILYSTRNVNCFEDVPLILCPCSYTSPGNLKDHS
jgi:hypothetical protein